MTRGHLTVLTAVGLVLLFLPGCATQDRDIYVIMSLNDRVDKLERKVMADRAAQEDKAYMAGQTAKPQKAGRNDVVKQGSNLNGAQKEFVLIMMDYLGDGE